MRLAAAAVLALAIGASACRPEAAAAQPSVAEVSRGTFLERRATHSTRLSADAPSPAKVRAHEVPAGAQAVAIRSDGRDLLAWFAAPPDATEPCPALAFFHGAFALTPDAFEAVRPFLDAGYCVLTPSWRGENGNGGRFELLWGELDDAVAAIQWLAARPEVDRERIVVAGHSVGGALAALVSLRPDAPVQATASIGGIYTPQTFGRWASSTNNAALVRFDPTDPDETELRVLGPHVAEVVHPHVAYVGEDDRPFLPNVAALERAARASGAPVRVVYVPGDHESSRAPALAAWLAELSQKRPRL